MEIDPSLDRPAYQQLADAIREQIRAGHHRPGGRLPSEPQLTQTYGLGRETVRRAMGVLRGEGLVITVQGEGTLVRRPTSRTRTLRIGPNDRITARMPDVFQRRRLGIDEGVPLVEVHWAGGEVETFPADAVEVYGSAT
jgi:DNA-binding FadR family transcriptional regulator